jgi:glycine cleavage system transcriptional repressor
MLVFPRIGARATCEHAMRRWFALSAIGRDRPGIVADLAELIYECDCNLEDSSMTILGSEFAVLLLLSGEGADVDRRLGAGCKRLEWEKRLTVFFRPLDGDPYAEPPGRRSVPAECEVTGVDKAGIVARVARTLADHGVNITALQTQSRPGPETGTPMFTMRIRMAVPAALDRRVLRERLERVAADLRVDVTLVDSAES